MIDSWVNTYSKIINYSFFFFCKFVVSFYAFVCRDNFFKESLTRLICARAICFSVDLLHVIACS